MSVDLVGSTAFKQSNQAAFERKSQKEAIVTEPWFSPIAHFYREVERLFSKHWAAYVEGASSAYKWPVGEPPALWKSAGDELLYTKVLSDHRESLACLYCWILALREYRVNLRRLYPALDIKSAAWIAGFPITNTEVVFRSSVGNNDALFDDDDPIFSNLKLLHAFYEDPANKSLTRDFIGPSIDTGFRLCSAASPRRLVLTVDLVLMVVHAVRAAPPGLALAGLDIHYQGRETFKGVMGGFGYPVFWIDMAHSAELDTTEDRLLNRAPRNTDDIKAFCEHFIAENKTRMIIPYIAGNPDRYFDNPPDHHGERLEALRDYYVNETKRRQVESESAAEPGTEEAGLDQKTLSDALTKLLTHIRELSQEMKSGPTNDKAEGV